MLACRCGTVVPNHVEMEAHKRWHINEIMKTINLVSEAFLKNEREAHPLLFAGSIMDKIEFECGLYHEILDG